MGNFNQFSTPKIKRIKGKTLKRAIFLIWLGFEGFQSIRSRQVKGRATKSFKSPKLGAIRGPIGDGAFANDGGRDGLRDKIKARQILPGIFDRGGGDNRPIQETGPHQNPKPKPKKICLADGRFRPWITAEIFSKRGDFIMGGQP